MMKPAGIPGPDPRQRLLELAERQGVSLATLSELIGRNSSYLQQYIRKGSPRKLDEGDRATLARFFGVGEAELGAPEDNSPDSNRAVRRGDWVDIPRLPLDASAGPGALSAEERAFDAFRFSTRWLREQGLEAGMLSAIAVAGDSMEPLLRDGDEILVDRTPRPLREGIHVLRLGDTRLVKRVQQGKPGRITLISENPHYPPIEVGLDEVDVIGRVVWKGGRL
jgi:phage repressor protein C with HTH and peptisase S24 domain